MIITTAAQGEAQRAAATRNAPNILILTKREKITTNENKKIGAEQEKYETHLARRGTVYREKEENEESCWRGRRDLTAC